MGQCGSTLVSSYLSRDVRNTQQLEPDESGRGCYRHGDRLETMYGFRQQSSCHFLVSGMRLSCAHGAMQASATLFTQITSGIFASEFSRLIQKYPSSKPPRGITEYDQFLALCFGQLTYRESLRDIVACLNSKPH